MKFKGFTLAEVLIVLGIIGVISALTMPTFTANSQNAQIGPKLGKAVASFEEATRLYMQSHQLENLSDIPTENGASVAYSIMNALRENMNWEAEASSNTKSSNEPLFTAKDGTRYVYKNADNTPAGDFANSALAKDHNIGTVKIDIAGHRPDSTYAGKSTFYFALYDDGSLIPYGSRNWAKWEVNGGTYWNSESGCGNKNGFYANIASSNETTGGGKYACAGSIFEQNMKVNYKLPK